jgi:hypothetical protein
MVLNEMSDRRILEGDYDIWGHYRIRDDVRGVVRATRSDASLHLETSTAIAPLAQPFMPFEGWAPSIAADPGSVRYKDRLYVVWPDCRSGRSRILSSFSSDEGKTWSSPRMVDDPPATSSRQPLPSNFMPMVAVNRDGIVGVVWYDRRDDPTNLGWSIRFAASLDGGETWLPGTRVSSQPNVFDEDGFLSTTAPATGVTIELDDRQFYAADTVGLTAAADGSFHPFWIDNRTGVPQVWTARIRVRPRRP